MGWLTGFAGTSKPARLAVQHEQARFNIREPNLHAQAGGPAETCSGGKLQDGSAFFVTGVGIRDDHILQEKDWAALLAQTETDLADLDGHFVVLRWQPGRVELFTDSTGTRTVYLLEHQDGVYFSTRLDWLAQYSGPLDIDYARFGAQWLLANSLDTTSLVKQALRLGAGGCAVVEHGRLKVSLRPWSCTTTQLDHTGKGYKHALQKALRVSGPKPWSLGLSGGLDSRALLALGNYRNTHVWGPPDHPDVQISTGLARIAEVEHKYFQIQLPEITRCVALLRERVALTQVITPASATVERIAYGKLHKTGLGIMDGGFGEIARRQLMNQIVFRRTLNLDKAQIALSRTLEGKADFFAPDVHKIMTDGAKDQINNCWQRLPASMTTADRADLLSVHSRLPNFFGLEQNYLDSVCVSYMPYAQPSVLRALFQVPLRLRWHGRLLRKLVRQHALALTHQPLVKGTVKYPFGLGTFSSLAYTRAKKKMGLAYRDPRPQDFISHLREFLLDMLHSAAVQDCAVYNQVKLRLMANSFASGDTSYIGQLDWWLAFETWRSMLRQENS
jgi:hypothetical protein